MPIEYTCKTATGKRLVRNLIVSIDNVESWWLNFLQELIDDGKFSHIRMTRDNPGAISLVISKHLKPYNATFTRENYTTVKHTGHLIIHDWGCGQIIFADENDRILFKMRYV